MSKDVLGTRLGIDRQLQDCRTLATSRGWTVEYEFVDNDVSASTGKRRPAYEQMLTAIRGGLIDAVIVWDLDRLTRRPIEIEHFIALADEHQLALGSVGGDVDLSTDNGRMFARIKGAVVRAEVERKSTRQKRRNLQAAQAGEPPMRRAFGFPGVDQRPPRQLTDTTPVTPEMVAAEAEAVRQAFADFLAGDTLITIAKTINAAGLTTTRGKPFDRNTVRTLLMNPRYAGLREYNKTVMGPGTWRALVSEEQWRAAVGALADPGRRSNTQPSTARLHLLAGIALCGLCDDGTTVKTGYGGTSRGRPGYRQYRCRKAGHLSRRAEHIDDYVEAVVIAWASSPEAKKYLTVQAGPDMKALREEEATLTIRLDQLVVSFADGVTSDQQLRSGTTRLRARLAEVQQAMKGSAVAGTLGGLVGPDARGVWAGMNLDRRRKAISLAFTVTLMPPPTDRPMSSRFDPAMVRVERR